MSVRDGKGNYGLSKTLTNLTPNSKVERVSSLLYSEGEQQMMIDVRQLPPSESFKIRVILESR